MEQANTLESVRSDAQSVIFEALSETQFCALEDATVRLQLQYDASQEEKQEEPSCPDGYFWNGRQCLQENGNLLRLSRYEQEGF